MVQSQPAGSRQSGAEGDAIVQVLKRITLDPTVMGGKACIRGLRVTVGTVLGLLAAGPSVFQVRAQDILRDSLEQMVIAALKQHEVDLASGAPVVVDQSGTRVRALPMLRLTD